MSTTIPWTAPSAREGAGTPANVATPHRSARGREPVRGWSAWRAAWRLGLAAPVLCVGVASVWCVTLLPLKSRRAPAVQTLIGACAQRVLRVLHVRVRVVGRRPDGPMLLASNHLSWIDILVAKSVWPDLQFVAKREVSRWPLLGRITRAAATVYVDRARRRDLLRAIPELQARLAGGQSVLLFAEGTTTDGSVTLPFKSSLFEGAVRAQVPVLPVTFRASTGRSGAPVATHVCWWGDTTLLSHLPRVAGTRGIEFTVRLGEPVVPGRCRKTLARSAHRAVHNAARHGVHC